MPNRILRAGILTSPRIAKLGWAEEVFYRRLHSVVDDFGRYYADAGMLRAACYPRQLNKVSDSDVGKWLHSCVAAGLVRVYPAQDGERYLEVLDFGQQVRAKKSTFPDALSACVADAQQAQSNAHLDVSVSVSVSEGAACAPEVDTEGFTPTPGGLACRAMRAAGMDKVNPGDPRLLALLAQGATVEELAGVAADAVAKGKGFAWALVALEGRRKDAQAIALAPVAVESANSRALKRQTEEFMAEQRERDRLMQDPEERAKIAAVIAARRGIKAVA